MLKGIVGYYIIRLVLQFFDSNIPAEINIMSINGRKLISQDIEICKYLASKYGCGIPHE